MTTEADIQLLHIQPDAIDEKLECIISILKELKDTSPTSLDHIKQLMQSLKKKEAVFGEDNKGRPVIQYKDEGKLFWDPSNANKLTQLNTDVPKDVKLKTNAFLELIDYLKKNIPPSGVLLVSTHVKTKGGCYREGKEFTKIEIVFGKENAAGQIIVVEDNKTKKRSALKTVMVSLFRGDEIRAMVDLNKTGISPTIYLFRVDGQIIEIFMEMINNAVTLRYVIDYGMGNISQRGPNLVRYFSLFVFHSLLSAVQKMHDKGWTHGDLHAGNIMLQESSVDIIQTRILDFGRAKLLNSKDGLTGFRTDIAEVVRKFTSICISQEFDSETDLKNNWKDKIEAMAKVFPLSEENTSEILCLVGSALQVTTLFEVPELLKEIEAKMKGQGTRSMLMDVAKILFSKPDNVQSIHPDSTGDGNTCTVKSDQNDGAQSHQDVYQELQ